MFDEAENAFFKIDNLLKGTEELTDKFDIEYVLLAVQSMQKKIDFLKELKKRRVDAIDAELSLLDSNITKLNDSIRKCMLAHGDKTLEFPGIGKTQVRKVKGTWQVLDETALMSYLQSNKMDAGIIENTQKINKKELNKLLNKLEENNNLPVYVNKEEDRMSLSISFNKEEQSRVSSDIVQKQNSAKSNDFDTLVI